MENDDIALARMIFAELTGVQEDASAIASEGQSPHTTPDVATRIIRRLDSKFENVEEMLKLLKALNTKTQEN